MPATLYDALLGAITLRQCTAAEFAAGNDIIIGRQSGALDPDSFYVRSGQPRLSWTSFDMDTIFGNGGISVTAGLNITSGNLRLHSQVRASGGAFLGSTSHQVISATNTNSTNRRGLVIANSFECSQTGEGMSAQLSVMPISGTGLANDPPISIATSQSLPSSGFNNRYFLGPALLTPVGGEATELPKVTSWTVSTGIETEPEMSSGSVWATDDYIIARNPIIEIRTRDQAALNAWGPLFKALDAVTVIARKGEKGGARVGDDQDEHIALSFGGSIVDVQTLSAQDTQTGEVGIRILGKVLSVSNTYTITPGD